MPPNLRLRKIGIFASSLFFHLVQMMWAVLFHHWCTVPFSRILSSWTRGTFHDLLLNVPYLDDCMKMNDTPSSTCFFPLAMSQLKKRGATFDDAWHFALGTLILHLIIFVVGNGFYFFCDTFKVLQEFKIPAKKNQLPSAALKWNCVVTTFCAMFISFPLLPLLFATGSRWGATSPTTTGEWALPLHLQYGVFVFLMVFNHVTFWIAHLLMHSFPFLYKFHKRHHEFLYTMSPAAEHASVFENVFGNFIPTIGGSLLLSFYFQKNNSSAGGASPSSGSSLPVEVWFTFLVFRVLFEALENHSNYDFRGSAAAMAGIWQAEASWHSAHHSESTPTRTTNLGAQYLDVLFGYADAWLLKKDKLIAPAQRWRDE